MKVAHQGGRAYYFDHPILDCIDDYLKKTLNVKYTRGYKLFIEDGMYELQMNMNNPIMPYTLTGDFENDDAFLKYACPTIFKFAGRADYLLLFDKTYL